MARALYDKKARARCINALLGAGFLQDFAEMEPRLSELMGSRARLYQTAGLNSPKREREREREHVADKHNYDINRHNL